MSRITVQFANIFAQQSMVAVPIESGTKLSDFLGTQGGIPEKAVVRVNRNDVASDYVLQSGDIVTLVPSQIKGA